MNPIAPMSYRTKKGKVIVTEGIGIAINYTIDPLRLKCQCSGTYRPGRPVCKHLEYYLCTIMGIDKIFLPVLSIPRVRAKLEPHTAPNGLDLNEFCFKFLTDDSEDQCIICHECYLRPEVLHRRQHATLTELLMQCPNCFELFHPTCYAKWSVGGRPCPLCKYKHDINGGKLDEPAWPS